MANIRLTLLGRGTCSIDEEADESASRAISSSRSEMSKTTSRLMGSEINLQRWPTGESPVVSVSIRKPFLSKASLCSKMISSSTAVSWRMRGWTSRWFCTIVVA